MSSRAMEKQTDTIKSIIFSDVFHFRYLNLYNIATTPLRDIDITYIQIRTRQKITLNYKRSILELILNE